jgi:hypothetical protein
MFDAVRFWSRAKPAAVLGQAEVPYPPGLNERMRQAHSQLARVFQHALESHRRSAFDACLVHLREFDQALRAYLGREQAEFEEFMTERLAGDPERVLAMRQVRARLRQLGREAHEMLQPPRPDRLNPALRADFGWTFEVMAGSLAQCVDTTELELMPLCIPVGADDAVGGTDEVLESTAWSKTA